MSLILDALRRADAERQRAQAPVLQQVAQAVPPAAHTASGRRGVRLLWAVGLLLVGVAALAWWATRVPGPDAAPPVAPAAPPATVADVTPAPSVVVPTPPPAAPPAAPARPLSPPRSPVVSLAPPAPPKSQVERPVPLSGLPAEQRSAIVRLGLAGGVHSADRRQSFVLVGGQLVREGATLAGDIVLERIEPRSAVLRVGDRLVEVPL